MEKSNNNNDILVAILAKNKGHCLPLYLKCIYNQTYPKKNIHLYIRTNNNTDNTNDVIEKWINNVGHEYGSLHYDKSDVDKEIEKYAPHEWNSLRFNILGTIRQNSILYALKKGYHYFTADCDNFIYPNTIEQLYNTGKNVIGPMLCHSNAYSNYHHCVDENGYLKNCNHYFDILMRRIRGIIEVDVIHCSYLIRHEILSDVDYFDDTNSHEYVRFSNNLRRKKIPQFIDNSEEYGYVTFADNIEDLSNDPCVTTTRLNDIFQQTKNNY